MDNKKILNQIGELIEVKLQPIKDQLGTMELNAEHLDKKVEKGQEEIIEALSELITSGYNSHEKRIKRIEDNLQLPPIH